MRNGEAMPFLTSQKIFFEFCGVKKGIAFVISKKTWFPVEKNRK